MATLLSPALLDETLRALPGWHGDPSEIFREVHLDRGAVQELQRAVEHTANAMHHAPRVEPLPDGCRFVLSTPEDGGVTELDVALASRISDLAHRIAPTEPGVQAVRHDDVEVIATPDDAAG